jgi:ATP:ADP antiporter, AAA family
VFWAPTLAAVLAAQVAQRWIHFALANPARQVFYTVLGREEKYKAKNLIDVVIYRGSDALYGWVFDSLQLLGLKLGTIALVAAPVSAIWLILSAGLGRAQEQRAQEQRAQEQRAQEQRTQEQRAKLIDAAATSGQ